MGIRLDHIAIPSRDPEAAANFLAGILGTDPPTLDGADDDMFNVPLSDGSSLLFSLEPAVPGHHIAFRVSAGEFAAIIARLRERRISFGNDPEDPANGDISDPLGGQGRAYFYDPDGHLFEVAA